MKKKSTAKSILKGFILGLVFAVLIAVIAVPIIFSKMSGVPVKDFLSAVSTVGFFEFLNGNMSADSFKNNSSIGFIGGADGPTAIIIGNEKNDLTEPLSDSTALTVATDIITRYKTLTNLGVVCDYEKLDSSSREYEEADSLITENQRMVVSSHIYKCDCCKTIDEAKAHRDKIMGENINMPITDLYVSNENGLYILEGAVGFSGYANIRVESFTETEITALADELDSGDNYFGLSEFKITVSDGGYILTSVRSIDA